MRVAHIITTLDTGGAQIMLKRLVTRLQAEGVCNAVISLGGASSSFDQLTQHGVTLHHLNMAPRLPNLSALWRLKRLLAAFRPDVVHTWLYHADLVGGLAAHLANVTPVVWGIHHTTTMSEPLRRTTRAMVRLNTLLSWFVPARVICCANSVRTSHVALGYARKKMVVIANGFDTDEFRPDASARVAIRDELGMPADTPIVGTIARFHPQKDHRTFIRAAGYLSHRLPSVQFVLAGKGVDPTNGTLSSWINATDSPGRFHLLGERHDMPRLAAACDLVSTSSAYGEGLPLTLGEAMCCGVPCVATDVGDSRLIVGDTGRVVPPGTPDALASAWESLLALTREERIELGKHARERVLAEYDLGAAVHKHLALYRELSRL